MIKSTYSSLVLVSILYLTFGCNFIPDKTNEITSLQDALWEIQSKADTFKIDNKQDTILIAAKGSRIRIPANAFLLPNGTPPVGNVKISVIEAFSVRDIIGHNLHTTSNGHLLETGGMINIEASANGVMLSLKADQTIEVAIPKNEDQQGMELFYEVKLDDGSITWMPADQLDSTKEEAPDTIQYAYYEDGSVVVTDGDNTTEVIAYPEELYDYHLRYINWRDNGLSDLKLKGTTQNLISFIENPANVQSEDAKKFIDNEWLIYFEVKIDENGKLHKYKIRNDPYLNSNRKQSAADAVTIAVKLLESAPPFDLQSTSSPVDHSKKYLFGICGRRKLNTERYKEWFRAQSEISEPISDVGVNNPINSYVFNISRLGWINCDRFYDIADSLKVNYQVSVQEFENTSVSLVFKNIKSVMTGQPENGLYSFQNIPIGSEVYIVAIGYKNKKPSIAILDKSVGKEKIYIREFKTVTLDELDQALDKIGW